MVPMLTGDWLIFVGKASKVDRTRLIKQYCRRCPVIAQCKRWADAERGFVGVAGGGIYSPTSDGKAHKRIEIEE